MGCGVVGGSVMANPTHAGTHTKLLSSTTLKLMLYHFKLAKPGEDSWLGGYFTCSLINIRIGR
jgi:hypothetical protein